MANDPRQIEMFSDEEMNPIFELVIDPLNLAGMPGVHISAGGIIARSSFGKHCLVYCGERCDCGRPSASKV